MARMLRRKNRELKTTKQVQERLAQKQECSFLNTREKRSATMSQGRKTAITQK